MIVAEGLLANKNEEKKKEIKRTVDGEKVLTKETMSNTIILKTIGLYTLSGLYVNYISVKLLYIENPLVLE